MSNIVHLIKSNKHLIKMIRNRHTHTHTHIYISSQIYINKYICGVAILLVMSTTRVRGINASSTRDRGFIDIDDMYYI